MPFLTPWPGTTDKSVWSPNYFLSQKHTQEGTRDLTQFHTWDRVFSSKMETSRPTGLWADLRADVQQKHKEEKERNMGARMNWDPQEGLSQTTLIFTSAYNSNRACRRSGTWNFQVRSKQCAGPYLITVDNRNVCMYGIGVLGLGGMWLGSVRVWDKK